jgi:type VI protein secretion system component VasK
MERAGALAEALFTNEGDSVLPQVRFAARILPASTRSGEPVGIASIVLTVDGADVTYENGPEQWKSLVWPGAEGKLGANIHFKDVAGHEGDIPGPGDWGLFRLLDTAKRIEPSPDGRVFTAVWSPGELPDLEIRIEIRPERTIHPFFVQGDPSKFMRVFRDTAVLPPLGIARDIKGCSRQTEASSPAPGSPQVAGATDR